MISIKDNVCEIYRQATTWGEIFENYMSDKGVVCKKQKEHLKISNKKTNNPV